MESYRQLPVKLYHVQTKFRDELRVRAGLLRVREFTMKDAYSLHASQDDLDRTYDGVVDAYRRIFARVGFRRIVNVRAHGGDMKGTKTDEFMLPNALGEDILYLCRQCGYGVNRELGEISACPQCGGTVDETKGIELGHVFQLERFYTERMNCAYSDESGARRHPLYASYGIGIGRTLGAIAEESAIEGGFVWPAAVAPFAVHLCALAGGEADARALYETLRQAQIDAILDARPDVRVGEQFADADLIGAPLRVVTGGRTPAGRVEVRLRRDNSVETPELSTAIHLIRRALKS